MDIDLPIDRLYHLLLDWFRSHRDVKVKDYSEPEFIKVRVGNHWIWREGKTPCNVNMNLEAGKTGITHVVISFDFSKVYTITLVITAIMLTLVGFFFGPVAIAFCLIPLIGAVLGIQWDINKTKGRFMDTTRNFLTGGTIRVQKRGRCREDVRPKGSQ